eukprot:5697262-Prymnesium_polylepis.1
MQKPSVSPQPTTRKRPRLNDTPQPPPDTGARWLVARDFDALLRKVSAAPWDRAVAPAAYSTTPAWWEHAADASAHWAHETIWLPCAAGAVAIHRFTPLPDAEEATAVRRELRSLVAQDLAAGLEGDPASNVGPAGSNYHSERDLWERDAVQEGALPWLVGDAVQHAAQLEAAHLGRAPFSLGPCPDEAWLNVTRPGGWNVLHTHAGSTYSGVFFVADGACCDGDGGGGDPLAGRLAFAPSAPTNALSEDQRAHIR